MSCEVLWGKRYGCFDNGKQTVTQPVNFSGALLIMAGVSVIELQDTVMLSWVGCRFKRNEAITSLPPFLNAMLSSWSYMLRAEESWRCGQWNRGPEWELSMWANTAGKNSTIRDSVAQLWQKISLIQVEPYLSTKDLERGVHAFITLSLSVYASSGALRISSLYIQSLSVVPWQTKQWICI